MAKVSKKRKAADALVDRNNLYSLGEAMAKVKEVNTTKFDASVDIHIRMGVDPRKADQAFEVLFPCHMVLVRPKEYWCLCTPDKEDEAREAGADFVGLDEMVAKIQDGWTDFDVVVATPNVMATVGKIGRILGPRGLMPNPKTGTVTPNVGAAVTDVKGGKDLL